MITVMVCVLAHNNTPLWVELVHFDHEYSDWILIRFTIDGTLDYREWAEVMNMYVLEEHR